MHEQKKQDKSTKNCLSVDLLDCGIALLRVFEMLNTVGTLDRVPDKNIAPLKMLTKFINCN